MRMARVLEMLIHEAIMPRHFDSAISATYNVVETGAMPVDIPEIILPIRICS